MLCLLLLCDRNPKAPCKECWMNSDLPQLSWPLLLKLERNQGIKRVMGISAKHIMNHLVEFLITYLLFIYCFIHEFYLVCPSLRHLSCNVLYKSLRTLDANEPLLITFTHWLMNSKSEILIEITSVGVALYLHYTNKINAFLVWFTCAQSGCLLNFKLPMPHCFIFM